MVHARLHTYNTNNGCCPHLLDLTPNYALCVSIDKFAIPGGFVSVGETAELATIREVHEETNLTVSKLEQFKLYSDPARDIRRHTASMVFRCMVDSIEYLHTGDDARSVKVVPLKDVLSLNLAFDHKIIFEDFMRRYHPHILSP